MGAIGPIGLRLALTTNNNDDDDDDDDDDDIKSYILQTVLSGAQMLVNFKQFDNPSGKGSNGHCCDGRWVFCFSACDHRFVVCLDKSSGLVCDRSHLLYIERDGGKEEYKLFMRKEMLLREREMKIWSYK